MASKAAPEPRFTLAAPLSEHIGKLFILSDILCLFAGYILFSELADAILVAMFNADPNDFYENSDPQRSVEIYIMGCGLCVWLAIKGHYRARQSLTTEGYQVLGGLLVVGLLDGYIQFALNEQPSRIWLVGTWLLPGLLLMTSRLTLKHALFHLGPWQCPVILVGSQTAIKDIIRRIGHDPYIGQVVTSSIIVGQARELREDLETAIRVGACRYVLVAFDDDQRPETAAAVRLIDEELQVPYGIIPGLRDLSDSTLELHKFFGHGLIVIHNDRSQELAYKNVVKRVFDIICATLLVIFLSPALLLIALLVRLDGGTVLYGSPRIGRAGKLFHALKFRSMVPNADKVLSDMLTGDPALREEWETNFKLKQDPRITRVGRVIRRTSMDELPQLINVLRGEMSLVGPRPLLPDERGKYTERAFRLYSRVTPGLTGVWQVSGRDGLEYKRRIELNNWYVKNRSLWLDVVILCKTFTVVIRRAGAS
jgi:Undecaprenyl-phosphate galactose phosphotransferase WbaP